MAQGGATPKQSSDEQLRFLCPPIRPASAPGTHAATQRRFLSLSSTLDGGRNRNPVSPTSATPDLSLHKLCMWRQGFGTVARGA
jgi:hypothetical protein